MGLKNHIIGIMTKHGVSASSDTPITEDDRHFWFDTLNAFLTDSERGEFEQSKTWGDMLLLSISMVDRMARESGGGSTECKSTPSKFDFQFIPEQMTFFQDPASVEMYQIIILHNNLFYYLYGILCVVLWCFFYPLIKSIQSNGISCPEKVKVGKYDPNADHCELLEVVWTIFPTILLIFIGYPGLELLYQFDDNTSPELIIKVIGNQWFWTYEETIVTESGVPYIYEYNQICAREWSETKGLTVKSVIHELSFSKEEQAEMFYPRRFVRWLSTDVTLQVPVATKIRFIGTSEDVIHSFAVPALGIKMDVCPGRLNKVDIIVDRWGWYYGQCSEFCGINHGFMPILISAIRKDLYWTSRRIIALRYEVAAEYKKTGVKSSKYLAFTR